MTTIHLFRKGIEDIFYDNTEGDIIIEYYLMCEVDEEENITDVFTFAYGGNDSYFYLYEEELLKKVKTLEDAKAFKVAKDHPASRENECRLSSIMEVSEDNPFFRQWMKYHRREYDWLYEEE